MKSETTIFFSLFVFSILIASSVLVSAQDTSTGNLTNTSKGGLVVRPAKLGIYRVTIPLFSDYVASKSFVVGNAYDFPLNISLKLNGNLSQIVELSETDFVLQPNETKTISYFLTIKEPGLYGSGIGIIASSSGKTARVGYQADLYVFAGKSRVPETVLYAVGGVGVVVAAFLGFKMFGKKVKGKKIKILSSVVLPFAIFILSVASFASFAQDTGAANIAMVVKDASSLDPTHEQRIYNILSDMGHDITLVDKNVGVNYNNFDLIVVAGRPLSGGSMDSFVANIPVNDVPTIAIDFVSPNNWGWVSNTGTSSLSSSTRNKVYPQIIHPLTDGYAVNQKVYVHLIAGYTLVDLIEQKTNMTTVASFYNDESLPIIAYANPNTQLATGKKVANNAAIVFFGITYPNLWTEDAVNLFKNSVNWLTSLDFNPPTVPQLATPDSGFDKDGNVMWQWTASNSTSGILFYEFQLSNSPTFSTILYNTTTTNLNVTTTGLADTQTYYARVRAWDSLNIYSNWSNVAQVTIDSSNLIVKINSPASGSTVSSGSSVTVNVTVASPNRMPATNGTCSVSIANTFAANLTFNKTINTCSGSVTAPTATFSGPSFLVVTAINSLGNFNSSTVPIYYQGPSAPSTSSSSSGGGSGSSDSTFVGALLFVQSPTQFTAHENSDLTFVANVKNDGLVDVETVKVVVEKMDIASSEVTPEIISSLPAQSSQNFTITLHFQEGSAGSYQFRIKILAYGVSITKRMSVDVLPEIKEPKLRVAGVQFPASFVAGQEITVNITLANDGNDVADTQVNLTLPTGWDVRKEDTDQALVIDAGSQEALLFHVTPSSESGKLDFLVNYTVADQEKTLTQSYDVNVTQPTQSGITALVTFIGNPEFFVPALVGLGAFLVVYFGMGGSSAASGLFRGLKAIRFPKISQLSQSFSKLPKISLAPLNNFMNSLRSTPTFRYVWPRGGRGLFINSFFGNGSSAPSSTASVARAASGRVSRTASTRVMQKTSMYDKWETRWHSPRRGGGS